MSEKQNNTSFETYHLEFITPCFCAGADQSKAEIRPASIRGALRWWFRVLGGNLEDEVAVFGGTSGDNPRGSSIVVRINNFKAATPWTPPKINQNNDNAYVWFFASVSGKQSGQKGTGPRWSEYGNLPPGTRFDLQIRQNRALSDRQQDLYQKALKAFLQLGAIGLRNSRGAGSFYCEQHPPSTQFFSTTKSDLEQSGFTVKSLDKLHDKWEKAISECGRTLKQDLRAHAKAGKDNDQPSPLGRSQPRQKSAVYLRPIRIQPNQYKVVLFEAPSEKVLSPDCNVHTPFLTNISP